MVFVFFLHSLFQCEPVSYKNIGRKTDRIKFFEVTGRGGFTYSAEGAVQRVQCTRAPDVRGRRKPFAMHRASKSILFYSRILIQELLIAHGRYMV